MTKKNFVEKLGDDAMKIASEVAFKMWPKVEIGKLIYGIEQGWSPQCEKDAAVSFQEWAVIKTTAVQSMNFLQIENKKLPLHLNPKSEFQIEDNDILMTRAGPRSRVAICCLVENVRPRLMLCDKAYRFRAKEDFAEPKYLVYFLNAPETVGVLNGLKTGISESGVNLTQQKFLKLEIPVAPLAEQKRIADKLDNVLTRVDACRERLDRVPALLKRFRQSVLASATSGELSADWREQAVHGTFQQNDVTQSRISVIAIVASKLANVPFELPASWKWRRLAEGISHASYGTSSKSSKTGEMPVLRMGNLQGGKLDWSDLVYSENEQDNSKYALVPGDLLFNRTNSPELVGKTSIYLGERSAIYAGYLIRVRCHQEVLLPKYVNFCLNSPYGRAYCWAVKSDGVSQSNINAEKLRAFPVPYCDVKEQEEIIRRVEMLFAFADRLETRLGAAYAATARLTPALLAKAFRGELVPQDPNDEPASELLKRLAVSRAAEGDKPGRGRAAKV